MRNVWGRRIREGWVVREGGKGSRLVRYGPQTCGREVKRWIGYKFKLRSKNPNSLLIVLEKQFWYQLSAAPYIVAPPLSLAKLICFGAEVLLEAA